MPLVLSSFASPLGDMLLVTDSGQSIRALDFADRRAHLHRRLRERYGNVELTRAAAPPDAIAESIARYFAGEFDALDSLPVAMTGSALQCEVWSALRRIPAGTTTTYGRLARALGFDDPRAAIEIGVVNRANPVAIVVPCHRVIGGNGDLKGYAWGVNRKRWLLEHENAMPLRATRPRAAATHAAW